MTQPTEQRARRTRTPAWVWIVLATLVVALGASIAVLVSEVRGRTSDVTGDVSKLNDGVKTTNDELTMLNTQRSEVEARVRGATGAGGTGSEQGPR